MLAESIVANAVRHLNRTYLDTRVTDNVTLPAPRPDTAYVLYAHVPFCERLCLYCSFNRFVFKEDRARSYFSDLRREMRMAHELGYDFASLYLGGGTPTILLDELVETIDLARELFSLRQISCETSPNHLDSRLVDALSDRVDRLSVGVQSFDDRLLAKMDRYTKYGSGQETFERISAIAGAFHSLNVDMMFSLPTQTDDILERDIELVKQTGANQTTFYPLMASPAKRAEMAATMGPLGDSREWELYRLVSDRLAPDFRPASAWTYSRDTDTMIDEYIVDFPEYVGIGSGALSFLDGRIYGNTYSLAEYSRRISSGRMSVTSLGPRYSTRALMRYRFVTDLFGLRLDLDSFEETFGVSALRALWPELTFMRMAGGIESIDDTSVTLTETGRYLLMVMMRETLATSNDLRDKAREALPPEERMLLLEGDMAFEESSDLRMTAG